MNESSSRGIWQSGGDWQIGNDETYELLPGGGSRPYVLTTAETAHWELSSIGDMAFEGDASPVFSEEGLRLSTLIFLNRWGPLWNPKTDEAMTYGEFIAEAKRMSLANRASSALRHGDEAWQRELIYERMQEAIDDELISSDPAPGDEHDEEYHLAFLGAWLSSFVNKKLDETRVSAAVGYESGQKWHRALHVLSLGALVWAKFAEDLLANSDIKKCAWIRCKGDKWFAAEDPRQEYCSKKCKNAANIQRHRDRQKASAK